MVTSGTLSVAAPASFSFAGVILNGTNEIASGTLSVVVEDATGLGAGWQVLATSTPFTTGAPHNYTLLTPITIASSAAMNDTCSMGATCALALTSGLTYPYTLPSAVTAPLATIFYDAGLNTGMGDQVVNAGFNFTVPANTYAGTYTSTWTISVVSGP